MSGLNRRWSFFREGRVGSPRGEVGHLHALGPEPLASISKAVAKFTFVSFSKSSLVTPSAYRGPSFRRSAQLVASAIRFSAATTRLAKADAMSFLSIDGIAEINQFRCFAQTDDPRQVK